MAVVTRTVGGVSRVLTSGYEGLVRLGGAAAVPGATINGAAAGS